MYSCLLFGADLLYPMMIKEVKIKNGPYEVLKDATFIGALPDDNLVMMGSKSDKCDLENKNKFLKKFNRDDEKIYGNVLVIKTDDNGDPVDFTIKDYMKLVKE